MATIPVAVGDFTLPAASLKGQPNFRKVASFIFARCSILRGRKRGGGCWVNGSRIDGWSSRLSQYQAFLPGFGFFLYLFAKIY